MKNMTANSIFRSLPNQSAYRVQVSGGKFYRYFTSKAAAARTAWAYASDGWPTAILGDDGKTIWAK